MRSRTLAAVKQADCEIGEAASQQNLQAIRSAELKAVKGADTQAKTQPTGPEKASSETADSSSAADASALVLADKASGHSPLSRHLAERERPLLADVARVEGSKQDVEVSMQDVEGAVSDGDGEVAFEGESTLAERNARLLAEAVDVESVPYHRIRKAPTRLDPGVGTPKRKVVKRTFDPRTTDGSPVRSSARRKAAPTIKQEDFRNGDINCPSCTCGIRVSENGCNMITCRTKNHTGGSWFYFCYHCRKECPGGQPCLKGCPERNDLDARERGQQRLNEAACANLMS